MSEPKPSLVEPSLGAAWRRLWPAHRTTDLADLGRNPTDPAAGEPMAALIERRLSRRAMLGTGAGVLAALTVPGGGAQAQSAPAPLAEVPPMQAPTAEVPLTPAPPPASTLDFVSLDQRIEDIDRVAEGYRTQVLIRWGDPVMPGAPAFAGQGDAAAQPLQFGYNNDFIAYLPLDEDQLATRQPSRHGILWINHEYTNPPLMVPGFDPKAIGAEHVALMKAAQGGSVIEIKLEGDAWQVVGDSRLARRITSSTPMRLSGPAAGHPRLRTAADPEGRHVLGTVNNCGGGVTPWGTILTCEENFDTYFGADAPPPDDALTHGELAAWKRYGVGEENVYRWNLHDPRFDLNRERNEANRFGWIVEIDPRDPDSTPIKRTALGRFKHEAAFATRNPDGRVVVYSGDDERFEYLYRFVSRDRYDPARPETATDLLDHGTLYVARFDDRGLTWLPLIHGQGPLTAENGFPDPASIAIDTRRAADLLGATPLDRPEDVEASPTTDRVYVALTNNTKRAEAQIDGPNPRAHNQFGHLLELTPPPMMDGTGVDHAAERFLWDVFIRGGDPAVPAQSAAYPLPPDAWLTCPDNLAFDRFGRLYIATDQGAAQARSGIPDGVLAADLEGPGRGQLKLLYRTPRGAEMTGPCFTPDGETLFLSVQHPGEGSTFEAPTTRWPDFQDDIPPRPAVVAIRRKAGGPIGGPVA